MGMENYGKRPERRADRRVAGFSIIELMIVLLLASAILAIGAPSFGDMVRNNQLTAAANDFLAAAQVARTEAIKRQARVVLCASSTPESANATCNNGDYTGWIAFVDNNGDCLRANNEPLVRSGGPLGSGIANSSDGTCLAYAGTGFLQIVAGAPGLTRLIYCDRRGLALQSGTQMTTARAIQISASGRAQITRNPVVIGRWEMPCSTH